MLKVFGHTTGHQSDIGHMQSNVSPKMAKLNKKMKIHKLHIKKFKNAIWNSQLNNDIFQPSKTNLPFRPRKTRDTTPIISELTQAIRSHSISLMHFDLNGSGSEMIMYSL